MERKKSFVFYFDALPAIEALEPEQRGHLFTAIVEFAIRASEGAVTLEEGLAAHPELNNEARIAFFFIAGHIVRDTASWNAAQKRRSEAARARRSADKKEWMDEFVR